MENVFEDEFFFIRAEVFFLMAYFYFMHIPLRIFPLFLFFYAHNIIAQLF